MKVFKNLAFLMIVFSMFFLIGCLNETTEFSSESESVEKLETDLKTENTLSGPSRAQSSKSTPEKLNIAIDYATGRPLLNYDLTNFENNLDLSTITFEREFVEKGEKGNEKWGETGLVGDFSGIGTTIDDEISVEGEYKYRIVVNTLPLGKKGNINTLKTRVRKIFVEDINYPPVIVDFEPKNYDEGKSVVYDLAENSSDPDGDILNFEVNSATEGFSATIADGILAVSGGSGGDSYSVNIEVSDPRGLTDTTTVTGEVISKKVNTPPYAYNMYSNLGQLTAEYGSMVKIDLSEIFIDPDGDPLTYIIGYTSYVRNYYIEDNYLYFEPYSYYGFGGFYGFGGSIPFMFSVIADDPSRARAFAYIYGTVVFTQPSSQPPSYPPPSSGGGF